VKQVTIFSDGACIGNPGPGGYGAIMQYGGDRRERSQGYRLTTNNRMELMGVITGLEALREPCDVRVVTDSEYVVKGITEGRAVAWRARRWRTAANQPAKNVDLWKRLLELCEQHRVEFEWVQGHAGHPENERCDALANAAAAGEALLVDEGYESAVAAAPARPSLLTDDRATSID
jgi:ribonuclease HI